MDPINDEITYAILKQLKDANLVMNISLGFSDNDSFIEEVRSDILTRDALTIVCYFVIVVISFFGNLLVCHVVARNRSLRRTTYIFIVNLALSDLMKTVLNIPFSIARILMDNWPFGSFMCSFVPTVQLGSVYVSTFTMTCIALDRYWVVTNPFKPRMGTQKALMVLAVIWFVAFLLALPDAFYSGVREVFTYRTLIRCITEYPERLKHVAILFNFFLQYLIPLTVTGVVYGLIIFQIWFRHPLGVVTEAQMVKQIKSKRKTIIMLVIVVIVYAVCWLPLNLYYIIREFIIIRIDTPYNSTIFFVLHWLAMSSVCYNPFIYCCLNKHFRAGAHACFACKCTRNIAGKLSTSLRYTKEFPMSELQCKLGSGITCATHAACSRNSEPIPCCGDPLEPSIEDIDDNNDKTNKVNSECPNPMENNPIKLYEATINL